MMVGFYILKREKMELHMIGKSYLFGAHNTRHSYAEFWICYRRMWCIYIDAWYQNTSSKAKIWNEKSESKPAVLHNQFSKLFQLHIYLINLKIVHNPCLNSLLCFPYKVIERTRSRPSLNKLSLSWTPNLITYVPSHFCLSSLLSKLHVQQCFCFLVLPSLFLEGEVFRTSSIFFNISFEQMKPCWHHQLIKELWSIQEPFSKITTYLFSDFRQKLKPFFFKLCEQSLGHHVNITSLIIIFHCILEDQSHVRTYLSHILISSTILSLHLIFYCTEVHWLVNNLINTVQYICYLKDYRTRAHTKDAKICTCPSHLIAEEATFVNTLVSFKHFLCKCLHIECSS